MQMFKYKSILNDNRVKLISLKQNKLTSKVEQLKHN